MYFQINKISQIIIYTAFSKVPEKSTLFDKKISNGCWIATFQSLSIGQNFWISGEIVILID